LKIIFPNFSGKLQWERDIPQDALDNLQNLANTDFHKNLGKIVHDIYLTAHNLFNDMPQGRFRGQRPALKTKLARVSRIDKIFPWPNDPAWFSLV
jgi:hypothetical protein